MAVHHPTLAVVGATGAVGREMLAILEERRTRHGELRLLASRRSAGQRLPYRGESVEIQELTHDSLRGVDFALFSAGGAISREYAPAAVEKHGCTVIDNSSAFRMAVNVPLVVPEINADALRPLARGDGAGIVANPNCSTIVMLMAVTPLHRRYGVKRIVASTYQAVSGAGAAAMAELERQTREVLAGEPPTCRVFPEPCAFNLFSHNTPIGEDGCNVEEQKMVVETHKIWADPFVRITATCVRVPIFRAHSESINLTLKTPVESEEEARQTIAAFPGVRIVDDRAANRFPTPREASGKDEVLVGRIRKDRSQIDAEGRCWGLDLFVSGDQLRKGAALNAIQIMETIVAMKPS